MFPLNRLDVVRELESGQIDLVIGWFGELPGGMRRATLYREEEAIVVRAGHPLDSRQDNQRKPLRILALVVELTGTEKHKADGFMYDKGVARRVWSSMLGNLGGSVATLQECFDKLGRYVLAPSVSGLFKWRQFEPEVILLAVGWYLRFSLSYRDVEVLLAERGISADHVTLWRWVRRYAPELERCLRRRLKPTNDSWRVDETYVRV